MCRTIFLSRKKKFSQKKNFSSLFSPLFRRWPRKKWSRCTTFWSITMRWVMFFLYMESNGLCLAVKIEGEKTLKTGLFWIWFLISDLNFEIILKFRFFVLISVFFFSSMIVVFIFASRSTSWSTTARLCCRSILARIGWPWRSRRSTWLSCAMSSIIP